MEEDLQVLGWEANAGQQASTRAKHRLGPICALVYHHGGCRRRHWDASDISVPAAQPDPIISLSWPEFCPSCIQVLSLVYPSCFLRKRLRVVMWGTAATNNSSRFSSSKAAKYKSQLFYFFSGRKVGIKPFWHLQQLPNSPDLDTECQNVLGPYCTCWYRLVKVSS